MIVANCDVFNLGDNIWSQEVKRFKTIVTVDFEVAVKIGGFGLDGGHFVSSGLAWNLIEFELFADDL